MRIERLRTEHNVKIEWVHFPLHPETPPEGRSLAALFGGRDDARRALLFDMDMAILRLSRDVPGNAALVSLTGCYHNLLRMWADA